MKGSARVYTPPVAPHLTWSLPPWIPCSGMSTSPKVYMAIWFGFLEHLGGYEGSSNHPMFGGASCLWCVRACPRTRVGIPSSTISFEGLSSMMACLCLCIHLQCSLSTDYVIDVLCQCYAHLPHNRLAIPNKFMGSIYLISREI